jgi:hypothetical protein
MLWCYNITLTGSRRAQWRRGAAEMVEPVAANRARVEGALVEGRVVDSQGRR